MIPNQKVVKNWKGLALEQFANAALAILDNEPRYDEVVLPADDIVELEKDHKTPPERIYPLPGGFEYNFSGWMGHVLGVRRLGIWDKY